MDKQILTCPNCKQEFEVELSSVDFTNDTGRLNAYMNHLSEFDDIDGTILCRQCTDETKDTKPPKAGNWYIY